MGSRRRKGFVNIEPRRDRPLALSPNIRAAPVYFDHIVEATLFPHGTPHGTKRCMI